MLNTQTNGTGGYFKASACTNISLWPDRRYTVSWRGSSLRCWSWRRQLITCCPALTPRRWWQHGRKFTLSLASCIPCCFWPPPTASHWKQGFAQWYRLFFGSVAIAKFLLPPHKPDRLPCVIIVSRVMHGSSPGWQYQGKLFHKLFCLVFSS